MKRIGIIIVMLLCILLVYGCEKTSNNNSNSKNSGKMVHEHCTRTGNIENAEVSLNYDLYYTGEVLNRLEAEEKVVTTSSAILDTYEESYRTISTRYDNLQYYDMKVVRESDSVTIKTTILYDKVNIQQLLSIEGEKDNIIENGVAKVEKWKELAKKFGTSCEVAE